ncbi:MAG: leucine-rich repeat domain-containing protein [Clostridia bacterium]|nr:leucine-rich repeat domain-containing protein [Clostridia bacterium]
MNIKIEKNRWIRKTGLLLFAVVMLLYAAIGFTDSTFGLFQTGEESIGPNMTVDASQNIVTVSNEAALRLAAENSLFNDILPVSAPSQRRYITLGADITLHSPLVITSDCNLDLNGYTLDLNGNGVELRNSYHGYLLIINGVIANGHSQTAYFDIVTPNAVVQYDVSGGASLIRTLTFDTPSVLQAALDMAETALSYGDAGNHFHSDIMLPTHYYGYPVDFDYVSANPAILGPNGKVTIADTSDTVEVGLTLTVSANSSSAQRAFTVKLTGIQNYAAWSAIGVEMFDHFFDEYRSEESTYTIFSDIIMPLQESYIADGTEIAEYNYRSLLSPDPQSGEVAGDIVFDTNHATLKARLLSSDNIYLEVTCVYGGQSSSRIYSLTSQNYNDVYQLANTIVGELYNHQLDVFQEQSFASGYTEYALSDGAQYSAMGVTSIQYALLNNDGTYVIDNGVLKVAAGFQPSEIQLIFLETEIQFGSAQVIVNIPIVYFESADVNERFLAYFMFFNGLLAERTNYNRTYTSFEMPFCYYGRMPIIKFEIYEDQNLYTGDAVTLTFVTSSQSYTTAQYDTLIAGLDAAGLNTLLNDTEARWEINIDWDELSHESMNIRLKYYYKFHLAIGWGSSDEYFSNFTVPGIINNIDIPDATLYAKLLNAFSPGEQRILAAKITRKPPVDIFAITLNTGETINSFKGIELLTGVTKLQLSNVGLTDAGLSYVAQLIQLEYLDISGNALTDIYALDTLTNLKIIDVSQNAIRRFNVLENFPYLEKAYVYDNIISGWYGYLYGSGGFFSIRVYLRLTSAGVEVYWEDDTTSFRETDVNLDNYNALNSIVYQQLIPEGAAISGVYASLSKAYQDYSVTPTSGFLHSNSVSFGTDGDGGFYIQFSSGFWGLTSYRVYFEVMYY